MKNTTSQKPTYQTLLKKCRPILELRILQIIDNIVDGNVDRALEMLEKINDLMPITASIIFDEKVGRFLKMLTSVAKKERIPSNIDLLENEVKKLADFVLKNANTNELIRFSQTG